MSGAGERARWLLAALVTVAVVAGLPWFLSPQLWEIVLALLKACGIAVVAYVAFVALLMRR